MQYLRRSVALFFALQQLKLDLASISVDQYQEIFNSLLSNDPGLQVLMTKTVKAKNMLMPFLRYRESGVRMVSDTDNVLLKHPLYKWTLTQSMLVYINDILKITDGYARQEWTQEMREDEVHFMFSLLSMVKFYQESIANKKCFDHFNANYIEDEAFLVLKEYGDDFGLDSVYYFYQLAFTPLPKKGSKEKRPKT